MLLATTFLCGCATIGWYAQAVRGQAEILLKREDIAQLVADPDTDDDLRRRLELALEIRAFASEHLALPDNRSYTVYADLEREAVVWNVVAAPHFSLEPKTWCYPLAGCLAYRGYFRKSAAEALATDLEADGFDTLVAPVPAYSTLGRFTDPVLNTMLDFDPEALAGLIFHELAHQRVFVPGETGFNETYATTVEREGIRRWLHHRGEAGALAAWEEQTQRRQAFNALLRNWRERLAELYASDLPVADMAREKARLFEAMAAAYRDRRASIGSPAADAWMAAGPNNARLALVATYESGTGAFDALLAEYDADLDRFHEAVAELARARPEVRASFLDPDS